MTRSGHPPVAIEPVDAQKGGDLLQSRYPNPFAQTRFQHANVAAGTDSQFASQVLLSQPAVHAR
jgi:hypothetical protein